MCTESNPEIKANREESLFAEFYTRLYPSGWDLSELCKPFQDSTVSLQKKESATASGSQAETDKDEEPTV